MAISPFRLGLAAALLTLALDQASKLYLLNVAGLPAHHPIDLLPFIELTPVWNRGVSWGMFQQDSGFGRWALTTFQAAAAIGLSIWLWRARGRVLALGLGLIIGGAIGNAIDRFSYGAVFDFIHFYTPVFDFIYVFNIADAAIVLGVPCLLYPEPETDTSAKEKP